MNKSLFPLDPKKLGKQVGRHLRKVIKKEMSKHLFDSEEAKYLWKKADDAKRTSYLLSEIYDDVLKELLGVIINVLEFQVIADKKLKKKVLKWLSEN